MLFRKISGILLVVIGVAMYLMSNYIADQVFQGKNQIASAQQKVDIANGLFSQSPYTKGIGGAVTSSGQKQIDEGKSQVSQYELLANRLHTGGVVICIAGAGLFLVGFLGKKKR
ncbi:MAG: hypothetical protein NTX49_08810 [Chlamydiae bacterium]|nr:hypothetical protein [Chlamydiota bacterium]